MSKPPKTYKHMNSKYLTEESKGFGLDPKAGPTEITVQMVFDPGQNMFLVKNAHLEDGTGISPRYIKRELRSAARTKGHLIVN